MVNFKKLRQMIDVKGNGHVVAVEKQVSSFIRLHLSISGSIELVQSNEEKVVIEADENLQDYFEIVNSGRTLYVTSEAKLRRPVFSSLNIKVYLRQVETLYNACHGHVSTLNTITSPMPMEVRIQSHGDTDLDIVAPSIKVNSACHGNVRLQGECGELNIRNASHGDLDCSQMIAGAVSINNASHGDIRLYSKESIVIKNYGHGDIFYYGPGHLNDVVHYGKGDIKYKG